MSDVGSWGHRFARGDREAGDDPGQGLARAALWLAAFGVVLRLVRYLQNYPLWCDESMLAVNLLGRNWSELARPLDYHQVCPLGFLSLVWTAVQWLGFSEPSLRLVPILCATASVPLFVLLARRVLGAGTVATVLAVGLFAVAQPPIRFAAEFKPYATDLLAATGLLLMTLKWRAAPGRRRWLLALAVAAPVCVSVSLPSLFVLAAVAVVGFFEVVVGRRKGLLPAYAAFLGMTAAGVVAMAAAGQYQSTPEDRAYFLNFWSQGFPPSWRDPGALVGWLVRVHTGPLFAYPHGPTTFPTWVNAVVFGFFVVGVAVRTRRDPVEVALLVLPFVFAFAASVVRRYPYGMSPRVAQFLVPSTLLLTAAGVERLVERLRVARPRASDKVLPLSNGELEGVSCGFDREPPSIPPPRGGKVEPEPPSIPPPRGGKAELLDALGRWAVPGLVGLLVAFGGWRMVVGLGQPYRTTGDRTAREFARWFWEELGVDAELVCVRSDLGIPFRPERWSYDAADLYLCYQRIYSARHRNGLPPRWDNVSPSRPLRCVLLNRLPGDVPGFVAWMQANRHRYALRDVRIYPAFRGTRDEPGQTYVVCEFLPVPGAVASTSLPR